MPGLFGGAGIGTLKVALAYIALGWGRDRGSGTGNGTLEAIPACIALGRGSGVAVAHGRVLTAALGMRPRPIVAMKLALLIFTICV